MMMKPWQAVLNKAPSKGEKEEQRQMTQVQARSAKTPKRLHQKHMPHTTEKEKNIAKQTNSSSLQLRPLIEFGSCGSASPTSWKFRPFFNWRNLLKKRSFF